MTKTHYKNKIFLSAVLVFVLSTIIAYTSNISGIELSIFRYINNLSDEWRTLFSVATQAGSQWVLFGLTLIILGKKLNRLAVRFFSSGVLAYVLSEVVKTLIKRPRPEYILNDTYIREVAQGVYGFPSGHTTIATAMALVIMLQIPRKFRWLCIAWIVIVGLSRIYLGVHAPLDVVGGICLGIIIVYGSIKIHGKMKFVRKITGMKLQR